MYDIHCHILPGIDDGARVMEESLGFARLADQQGVRLVAATPHIREGFWENRAPLIEDRVAELNQAIERQGLKVRVVIAAEIFLTSDVVDAVQTGEFPTYGNRRRHFLFELPSYFLSRQVEEYVFHMRTAGITPIIAHPERNGQLVGKVELLENLVRMGALTQVTAMSVTGRFGRQARRAVEGLFERGLVHTVASDAHNLSSRPLELRSAYDRVASKYGPESAERLFVTNPCKILEGEELDADSAGPGMRYGVEPEPGLRGFLSRLLS